MADSIKRSDDALHGSGKAEYFRAISVPVANPLHPTICDHFMKPFRFQPLSPVVRGSRAVARIALVAILLAIVVGCKPAAKNKQVSKANWGPISAAPNPVPAGAGNGATAISWTGDGSFQEVYVSINGDAENRCWGSAGKTGTFDAPWINAGAVYEFRLYRGNEHKDLIGSVKVTRNKE